VPIYNVEDYLAECLDSLAAQTFSDYEVVVVDDGSPDGSRRIADEYASRDARIRVITRENGGLGAARNTGVRHARGRFLTFLDSDDVLPPNALNALVTSAHTSGSDIVVGSLRRFDEARSWAPGWVDRVHLVPRTAVRLEEFLPLIRNLYTCDKLFRRDFWQEQDVWFREGVAYEDQPLVTQLLARARAIDVIPDAVYHYRRREDLSSISQQTATLADLRQRIEAWRISRETLTRETSEAVYQGWLQTLFDAHFHWYLTSPGTADDQYWVELQSAVSDFAADAPPSVWRATSPDKRVLLRLTVQDRREDAQELVRRNSRREDLWRATPGPDGVVLELPFLDDPELDESLFLIRPEQLRLGHSVENVHWHEGTDRSPGTCSISGWAFIRKIDLAKHQSEVSVVLRSATTGAEHVVPAQGPVPTAFASPVDDSWSDYSSGTFGCQLPLAEILAGEEPGTAWDVLLRVSAAGFTVTEPVSNLVRSGSAGVIPAFLLPDGDRLVADWRVHQVLRFRREPIEVLARGVRLEGRRVSGVLEGPRAENVRTVVLTADGQEVAQRLPRRAKGPRRFDVAVPAGPRKEGAEPTVWTVSATAARATRLPVTWEDHGRPDTDSVTTPAGTLTLSRQRNGELAVTQWSVGAVADEVQVARDDALHVEGRVFGAGISSVAVLLRHKKTRVAGAEVSVSEGRFAASVPLEHELYRFGRRPLPTGDHDMTLQVRSASETVEVPLRLSPHLSGELPVAIETDQHQGRVVRGPGGGVRVVLIRPIGDVRGRYHQQRLRSASPWTGPLTRGVLMRSYFGESATDNSVAVQAELQRRGSDLPVYWAVQDKSVPVPEGGIPVVVNSREWYQLLGSVSYYMDNMFQPEYHSKPTGQVIVQTFHGYPFKVMGRTHWRNLQVSQARIDAYAARAAEWDYLVSPARYATPLLRREFDFHGEVLEIGYPRNDVLQSPQADEIRRLTRRSLGIRDDQVAVLYAPTFRDYLARGDRWATMADFLDLRRAVNALGDRYVLLVRGHAFNARSPLRVGSLRGVIDVTDYPEVSDLYLAADAGVVDYSSLRFDFAVTGKPLIFLVPDLERYLETRGWIIDFEPTAPGPLVTTTEEVVAHLLDLDAVRADFGDQYDRFRSEYLDLEDGHAAARLVDAVFASRGDA